jgi:hypothetical protein
MVKTFKIGLHDFPYISVEQKNFKYRRNMQKSSPKMLRGPPARLSVYFPDQSQRYHIRH